MKCNFCGNEIIGRPSECEICGHVLQYENANPQRPIVQGENKNIKGAKEPAKRPTVKKGKRKPKKIFGLNAGFVAACAAILLVIILIPTLIIVSLVGDEKIETNRMHAFYSKTTGTTSIVESGAVYEKTVEGAVVKNLSSSDGKTQAILSEYGDLYIVSGGEIKLISSGVKNFVISADGSKVAYLINKTEESSSEESTEEEETTRKQQNDTKQEETTEYTPAGPDEFVNSELSLFLYDGASGESEYIENSVAPTSISLSPAGNTVCYTKSDDEGESFDGYICSNGVITPVGRNSVPIAASDDKGFLYYVKYEIYEDNQVLKLFVKNGEKEEKIGEYSDGNGLLMYLNTDFSEMVFSVTGKTGNFFLWTAEKGKQKISSGFSPIYPFGKFEISNGRTTVTPLENFAGFAFSDNENIASYIDNKYFCTSLDVRADFYRINADMDKLYFVDKNEYLFEINLKKIKTSEIASHVLNFDISVDGEMIYYINSDKELRCVDGSDSLVSENVNPGKNGLSVTEGGYLYYLKDYTFDSGTLCYIKNGGSEHEVENAKNVYDIIVDTGDNVYYRSDYGAVLGTYDLYYGKGNQYKLLFKNVG